MARRDKLLDQMRANPRDWRIEDVVRSCARSGLDWLVGNTAHLTAVDDATGGYAGSVQIRV